MAGRGEPINQTRWPAAGARREWLSYCDTIHRRGGMPSQRTVARAMNLKEPGRVGLMLRGEALPSDEKQACALVVALGALESEVPRGLRLYRAARAEPVEAPSAHLDHVRGIAPVRLLDREPELGELAAWAATGDESYVWWQAEARAGKSALMAWFAAHPPPGVRIVSFFVTARLPGESDSTAFAERVLDQIAEIISGPAAPGRRTHPGTLQRLLAEAAAKTVRRGQRLVLLVDGLDEDCGTLPGSGMVSIAACLPRDVPPGLRVVVAGRPDPPLPGDLDADHPLRGCRVRRLAPSPHAQRVTELAQREIDEALATDPGRHDGLGCEVLGLLAASGGGLRHADLQELTGRPAFQIDRLLHGVFGRTIARGADEVLMFTHETLREQADDRLGAHTAGSFRDRIHAWADGYRQREWPSGTPAYLLRDYPRLLRDRRDAPRLTALAIDRCRQRRLFDVTRAAGLGEIVAAEELLLARPGPDLPALARLAANRDRIARSNEHLPHDLPTAWVLIGDRSRAEALARSTAKPADRVTALSNVAATLAATGDTVAAAELMDEAVALAGTIGDTLERSTALLDIVDDLITVGNQARAEAVARSMPHPMMRGQAFLRLATVAAEQRQPGRVFELFRAVGDPATEQLNLPDLAAALSGAGAHSGAVTLTRHLADPLDRTAGLVNVAIDAATADAGSRFLARALTEEAETFARAIARTDHRVEALTMVVRAAVALGDHDQAAALIAEAEGLADGHEGRAAFAGALIAVGNIERAAALAPGLPAQLNARVLAEAAAESVRSGRFEDAIVLAGKIDETRERTQALVDLVAHAVRAGADDAVAKLADSGERVLAAAVEVAATIGRIDLVEALAGRLAGPSERAQALITAAIAAVDEDPPRFATLTAAAAAAVDTVVDKSDRARLLVNLAIVLTAADRREEAATLAARAELVARGIGDPRQHAEDVGTLAEALMIADQPDEAERLARTLAGSYLRATTYAAIAATQARRSRRTATVALTKVAREAIRHLDDSTAVDELLGTLVEAALAVGETALARDLAAGMSDRFRGADATRAVIRALAATGDRHAAESCAEAAGSQYDQDEAFAELARLAAAEGDYDRAEALAARIAALGGRDYWFRGPDSHVHRYVVRALAGVVPAIVANGDVRRAVAVAARAETLARGIADVESRLEAMIDARSAAAVVGDSASAATLDADIQALVSSVDDVAREQAWIEMAESAVAHGDHARAASLASNISHAHDRGRVLAQLARAAADAGDLPLADATLLDIPVAGIRDEARADLARRAAETGDHQRAEALFHALPRDSIQRHGAFFEIVEGLAAAGRNDRAEAFGRAHAEESGHLRMFSALAVAAAAAGNHERAVMLAREIGALRQRARALIAVAEAAPRPEAARAVAEALMLADWRLSVKALAEISPAAVRALAEEVTRAGPDA